MVREQTIRGVLIAFSWGGKGEFLTGIFDKSKQMLCAMIRRGLWLTLIKLLAKKVTDELQTHKICLIAKLSRPSDLSQVTLAVLEAGDALPCTSRPTAHILFSLLRHPDRGK